jgi:hypothetical protein
MDGEIEGREGDEMAAHVRDCAECSASLQGFRAVSAGVMDYRDRFVQRPSRNREWLRVAAIAAVVLLAILISRGVGGIDRRDAASVPSYSANSPRGAPVTVIRVAVPIDEILPQGAAPVGINLQADLVVAADGTPVAIRLAP